MFSFLLIKKIKKKGFFHHIERYGGEMLKSGLLNKNEKDFNRNPQINDYYFKYKTTHEHFL